MMNVYRLFYPMVSSTIGDGKDAFDFRQKTPFVKGLGETKPFRLFRTTKPVYERISIKVSTYKTHATSRKDAFDCRQKTPFAKGLGETKSFCLFRTTKPVYERISSKVSTYKTLAASRKVIFDGSKDLDGKQQTFSIVYDNPTLTPKYENISSRVKVYKKLNSGMIVFRDYLSLKDQVDIVNICEKGKGSGWFYEPRYRNGVKYRLYTMCFGRNWDPQKGYNKSDAYEPPPLPYELVSLAETAVQDAKAYLDELPSMCPDMCRVNFYKANYGRLGLHQDCGESIDSLKRGLPVVYFSIGQMAKFVYGDTSDKKKLKDVLLCSGDVLIFGGKSRLIYHGVDYIADYGCVKVYSEVALRFGHLSLTLRQF